MWSIVLRDPCVPKLGTIHEAYRDCPGHVEESLERLIDNVREVTHTPVAEQKLSPRFPFPESVSLEQICTWRETYTPETAQGIRKKAGVTQQELADAIQSRGGPVTVYNVLDYENHGLPNSSTEKTRAYLHVISDLDT